MAINNFTKSEFCFPFEVEIDLSNDLDGCGKEIENLLKELKITNDEENQTKNFCVFEIKLASDQIVRKGISLAEWWKIYGKLMKWHKEEIVRFY